MNQRRYSWNSAEYLKHSSAQYAWAEELIGKLRLQGGESVLDIDCGDGKVTAMIAAHVPGGNVTGIDSAGEMISFARNAFPHSDHPNLCFERMDATNLSFQNRFDIAFSNATLHWVRDHISVLRGVKKALKRSGKILFQMGGRGNARDMVDTVAPEDYRPWLDAVGLLPKRIELISKDMTQKGEEGLAGWFRTTWLPYTDRISYNKREDFVVYVVGRYLKRFPIDSGGLAHVKMVRLEVEAVNQ